ncbi:MAG: UbiA family prenyltransferase [Pseudomonadota bacterium]
MTQNPADRDVPLAVDMDGTLLRTDTLLESFWKGLGAAPLATLRIAFRHWRDRPALKHALAALAPLDPATLPVDAQVVDFLDAERATGRHVALVSGAAAPVVAAVAAALGPFDAVQGSDRRTNLTAARKAAWLSDRYGAQGFDYIGDSAADVPVWQAARRAYVARPSGRFLRRMSDAGLTPLPIGMPWDPLALLRGLRPHQWLKNTLLILPLVAAHRWDLGGLGAVLLGFVAFSALASSIYILNDLTDLEADRRHDSKRHRPFAAGAVPLRVAMVASAGLAVLGLGLGALLGWGMLAVLVTYLITTSAYSVQLKRVRWADVTTLAGLYTLRVIAGGVATGAAASGWLVGFIFPMFLALGCVKRLTELARAETEDYLPGRRYRRSDRQDLMNIAILAAGAAVAVFAFYTRSPDAALLYDRGWLLGPVAVLLTAWLARMIGTGWRGQQDYDPIVFALTDRIGLSLIVAAGVVLVIAAG